MNKAYTTAARRLIISNPSCCNVVFRQAAGSEIQIAALLNNVDRMCQILRNVTRVPMDSIERMLESIASTGVEDSRVSAGDVQTVLMQNAYRNKGR